MAIVFAALGSSAAVQAESSIVHVVRPGETLASIAERYYGDPRRESVLVAENGLTSEGGSEIVVGLRLSIPTVSYHRVQEGETWSQLAADVFGDARRAFVLHEANGGGPGEQPDPGAELLVAYPLRHVVAQHESIRSIAKLYYPNPNAMNLLRRFNNLKAARLQRGQIVLVPLTDLLLSEQGRKLAEQTGSVPKGRGDVRDKQARIDEQLPALRDTVRHGRYAEAVALASKLLGAGDLTGNQIVTIQRELGTAFVALGRDDLAREAFVAALVQQSDLDLDLARTSPRVLGVFAKAREQHQAQKKAAANAKKADAGVAMPAAPPTGGASAPDAAVPAPKRATD
jgi:hypothetical protein